MAWFSILSTLWGQGASSSQNSQINPKSCQIQLQHSKLRRSLGPGLLIRGQLRCVWWPCVEALKHPLQTEQRQTNSKPDLAGTRLPPLALWCAWIVFDFPHISLSPPKKLCSLFISNALKCQNVTKAGAHRWCHKAETLTSNSCNLHKYAQMIVIHIYIYNHIYIYLYTYININILISFNID